MSMSQGVLREAGLPMKVVVALIATAWLSFFSVVLFA